MVTQQNVKLASFLIKTSARAGVSLFLFLICLSPQFAHSIDLFRTEDQKEILSAKEDVDNEYDYRVRVEKEAAAWAQDLMYMYVWNAKHPAGKFGLRSAPRLNGETLRRIHSEFSWMVLAGYGSLATFDFKHAQTTLAGSTSRFVSTLIHSESFWVEVRRQCAEIDPKAVGTCAKRLHRDITISQFVGSNASLFIGSGVVIGLGKRLYQKFAAQWFAARVLPFLPAFAKTKWALLGLAATVIVVPAGFVVAGISHEKETNKVFYEDLDAALRKNTEEADRASILKSASLATEREVLEMAKWINENLPKHSSVVQSPVSGTDQSADSERFVSEMRIMGPNYSKLVLKRAELEARRSQLETELGSIPGISPKLSMLAEARKHGPLQNDDAILFRKAQYLASLRLVLKSLPLTFSSVQSSRSGG